MLKIITNKQYYFTHSNQGYSVIGMTIILLCLSGILMSEFIRISFSWQKKSVREKQSYLATNNVLSSITWATTLRWQSPSNLWQCQYEPVAEFNACIRQAELSNGDYIIIRGQSGRLKQYHLANYMHGILTIEKGHWIDYCPENKREMNCE